jgi:hypothetical protein
MSKANEPAFPTANSTLPNGDYCYGQEGLTKRELAAMLATNPSEEEISQEMERDRRKNPHNDGPPKPRLRERLEVVAALKLKSVDALLAELEKEQKP